MRDTNISSPSSPLPSTEHLQWQCRRGMLELDYMLRDFLDGGYPVLSEQGKRDFVRLLETPDPVLFDWLMGRCGAHDPAFERLIRLIRGID